MIFFLGERGFNWNLPKLRVRDLILDQLLEAQLCFDVLRVLFFSLPVNWIYKKERKVPYAKDFTAPL